MKITVEFDSLDDFEAFRASGKKTRGKKDDVDEQTSTAQATTTATMQAPQTGFTPPATAVQGFPGAAAAGSPAAQSVNPLVPQIIARAEASITSGQPLDNVVNWFRQLIGPDAANATWDQIKAVFLPRMPEAQLKQVAAQVGITG